MDNELLDALCDELSEYDLGAFNYYKTEEKREMLLRCLNKANLELTPSL